MLLEYDLSLKVYSLEKVYFNINLYLDLRIRNSWSDKCTLKYLVSLKCKQGNDDNTEYLSKTTAITTEAIAKIVSKMRTTVNMATRRLTYLARVVPNFLLAKNG